MRAILALAGAMVAVLACGTKPQPAAPVEVPPQGVNVVQPAYPEEARKAGIEGTAMVQMTVAADGAVFGCSLVTSSGNGALDQAALQAARESKFAPGTRDGKPVEMRVTLPFRFRLDGDSKTPRGAAPNDPFRAVWREEPQCRRGQGLPAEEA